MLISSFSKTNLASARVKELRNYLIAILIAYIFLGVIYLLGASEIIPTMMEGDPIKANTLFRVSIQIFFISIILTIGFVSLKWQILRTALWGTSLLSAAYLLCAIVVLWSQMTIIHNLILYGMAFLFLLMFILKSNIRIYLRDKTYIDALIESSIAIIFLTYIIRMLIMGTNGGLS